MKINSNILIFMILMGMMAMGKWFVRQEHARQALSSMTNEIAIEPDLMIRNANHYLHAYQTSTAIGYIEEAIKSMKMIGIDADSLSFNLIENAIDDLKKVERELEDQDIDRDQLNYTLMKVLNSLAYAQLKLAEDYQLNGEKHEAQVAMRYALQHLQNAFRFSPEYEMEIEVKAYQAIDSLIDEKRLPESQMLANIEMVLTELEKVLNH